MPVLSIKKEKEVLGEGEVLEREVITRMICLLVEENLLCPEEQIRFLSILNKEA